MGISGIHRDKLGQSILNVVFDDPPSGKELVVLWHGAADSDLDYRLFYREAVTGEGVKPLGANLWGEGDWCFLRRATHHDLEQLCRRAFSTEPPRDSFPLKDIPR